jgi:hypothetical protein
MSMSWLHGQRYRVNRNYDHWENVLRNSRLRKIKHNTWVENTDGPDYPKREGNVGDISIRFHGTRIIVFHRNGDCTIDFAGWQTSTTKDRINDFSPVYVWSQSGFWFFELMNATYLFDQKLRISDGLVYDSDGMKVDCVDSKEMVREHKRELARIRRKHWGIRRSNVYKVVEMGDWTANFMLNVNRTIQWVHGCEANEVDKYAAIGRKVKRCKLCHTELDRGMRMAVELQKVK